MIASKPAEQMDPNTANNKSGRAQKSPALFASQDGLCIASLAVFTMLYFFKTCFAGGTISRLCVLAEWDSVFDAWRTGQAQAYDPSLVQIFGPDYVFLAKHLSQGLLPLWNPHSGLGYPFVADIQSSVFAPMRMIFNFLPSVQTYNYYLLTELFVCAIGTFFLAKALGLTRLPAVFAAIAYTFCPYNMWYLEMNLGASACLFPLCTLGFVHAAEKRTLGAALLAGITAGILILSGHPECSFFGIILSSAFLFFLAPEFSKLLSTVKILAVAAISTVAVSAPALFPFAEYLMNGESYKYGSTYSTPVSWNGILFNLCNPGQGGASPFLGIIAVLLLPFSLLALRKQNSARQKTFALFSMTALTFLLVSQLGPVQLIFSKAPFTAIITRYALPYLLLLLAILAGCGLREVARFFDSGSCRRLGKVELACSIVALAILPALAFLFTNVVSTDANFMKVADFDAMLPRTALNASAWKRDIFCTLAFGAIVFGSFFAYKQTFAGRNGKFLAAIVLIVGLVCGFISQASIGKLSLPLQSKFFYPETELTQKLKDDQFRTISTCEYVFRPATNAVYGVNFLTVHNPLFPKRFLEFTKACGARTDVFNQTFESKNLSPLLNLASVKYILSLDPITDPNSPERFRLYFESKNGIKIYENTEASPRAYLVHEVCYSDAEYSLEKLQTSAEQDSYSNAIIEQSEARTIDIESIRRTLSDVRDSHDRSPAGLTGDSPAPKKYEAVDKFESPDSDTVKIECTCVTPGWLILTDIFYPGWNAYVDGNNTEILRANYTFRAVRLDMGKHQVIFKYEPFSSKLGSAIIGFFAGVALWILKSNARNFRL